MPITCRISRLSVDSSGQQHFEVTPVDALRWEFALPVWLADDPAVIHSQAQLTTPFELGDVAITFLEPDVGSGSLRG